MQRAAQAYLQTRVTTTSQGDVVLLLFDGAVKFLQRAKESIDNHDFAAKGILISKALDVINELDSTLNIEKGGEIAKNLHNLYMICNTKLLKASLKLDKNIVDEVIAILSGLRSAFAEILPTPEAQGAINEIAQKQQHFAQPIARNAGMIIPNSSPQLAAGSRVRNLYAQKMAETNGIQSPQFAQQEDILPKNILRVEETEPTLQAVEALKKISPAPDTPTVSEVTIPANMTDKEAPVLLPGEKAHTMAMYKKFASFGTI